MAQLSPTPRLPHHIYLFTAHLQSPPRSPSPVITPFGPFTADPAHAPRESSPDRTPMPWPAAQSNSTPSESLTRPSITVIIVAATLRGIASFVRPASGKSPNR